MAASARHFEGAFHDFLTLDFREVEEGAIRVVAESADVTVYTMTGQTVAVAAVDGGATIRLAAGFYIVRVGGTTVKVVVK